ncbi:DUF7714 family protein [Amycolatopsis alkalitolerans]|uniref:Uncharacterized protein n=1 Tax=Amycolatopsis alkalitolerans TaxID=2547244 RepID=A0A5C4M525_9PSEU|nr:hypothetical protein [Amycolatopsis alkalitolerans]TNC28259.1 hypothetical protein FG385_07525 [Amycolatopsis alkalitolerans]
MIPEPRANHITRPYRGLSVQEVAVPLTEPAISALLTGREVYRRTEFLVLRNGSDAALVAVRARERESLFSPVAELRVLSTPDTTVWVDDPSVDVGNATALAAAAAAHRADGALAYVVRGRFEHVNVIWRPAPVRLRVAEVVPPEPPKLFAMAQQAIAFDEDLPPIELVLDAVDIRELADARRAAHYLLPCRGSGVELPGAVSFLDTRPAERADWLLIGCERSRQFHRHFYGDEPATVDLCPRARAVGDDLLLTKCCLRERGIEVAGNVAVVPWGSTMDEVRAALRRLCGVAEAAFAEPAR